MTHYKNKIVRSITFTVDLDKIGDECYLQDTEHRLNMLREKFCEAGFLVRTIRINTKYFSSEDRLSPFRFLAKMARLSNFCQEIGVRWFNVCFDLCGRSEKDLINLTDIGCLTLRNHPNSFINFIVARDNIICPKAAMWAARAITKISKYSSNGYDNFRAGVSLNPAEGTPFFPFSFALNDCSFSIALETTQCAIGALKSGGSSDLLEARRLIKEAVSDVSIAVDYLGKDLEKNTDVKYNGVDISFAPFPDEKVSVIDIISLLGSDGMGPAGTYFITSFLTDILKSIISSNGIRGVGFNGVMYSLLEDHEMCRANDKKLLSVESIIGYSALCGCGLDMVPLPGAFLEEELASIILDVAAIAIRLDKPLGVRVLPIPNSEAHEFTNFDSDFLTNTRILPLRNRYAEQGILAVDEFKYIQTN
jgi:uncharacterized protein (UPF0210 family)